MIVSTNIHSSNDDVDLIKIFSKLLRLKWKILKYTNDFFFWVRKSIQMILKQMSNVKYQIYHLTLINDVVKFNIIISI